MASNIKKQIELEPPKFPICKEEEIRADPTTCALCNGAGGKYTDSMAIDYNSEKGAHYKACVVCKGSGKVQAIVNIKWQSAGEIMQKYKTAID